MQRSINNQLFSLSWSRGDMRNMKEIGGWQATGLFHFEGNQWQTD